MEGPAVQGTAAAQILGQRLMGEEEVLARLDVWHESVHREQEECVRAQVDSVVRRQQIEMVAALDRRLDRRATAA